MGEVIFYLICLWALALGGGAIIGKLTWRPPGQGGVKWK